MNERIRTLWLQAGGTFTSGNQHEWPSARIDNPEKFAELIVRECAEFVQFYYKDHACEMIAHDMKKHFGVEE